MTEYLPERMSFSLSDHLIALGFPVKKFSNRGLILIGGIDSKSHVWDSGAIEEYVKQIVQREPEVIWTVSSSPRTPADTVQRLIVLGSEFEICIFLDLKILPAVG